MLLSFPVLHLLVFQWCAMSHGRTRRGGSACQNRMPHASISSAAIVKERAEKDGWRRSEESVTRHTFCAFHLGDLSEGGMGGKRRCGRVYWYLLEHEEACGMFHRIDGPLSRVLIARRGFTLPRVVLLPAQGLRGTFHVRRTGFLESRLERGRVWEATAARGSAEALPRGRGETLASTTSVPTGNSCDATSS
jgi:hypothetical protein